MPHERKPRPCGGGTANARVRPTDGNMHPTDARMKCGVKTGGVPTNAPGNAATVLTACTASNTQRRWFGPSWPYRERHGDTMTDWWSLARLLCDPRCEHAPSTVGLGDHALVHHRTVGDTVRRVSRGRVPRSGTIRPQPPLNQRQTAMRQLAWICHRYEDGHPVYEEAHRLMQLLEVDRNTERTDQ
jgi:hypothetical protein